MKLKRIMASILCLAMVLSAMGTVAFAEETAIENTTAAPEDVLKVGSDYSTVYYGGIPWRVLAKDYLQDSEDADSKKGILLLSEHSMGAGTQWNSYLGNTAWNTADMKFARPDVLSWKDPRNTSGTDETYGGYMASELRKYLTGEGEWDGFRPIGYNDLHSTWNMKSQNTWYFIKHDVTEDVPQDGVTYYVRGEFEISDHTHMTDGGSGGTHKDGLPHGALWITEDEFVEDTWYTFNAETGDYELLEEYPADVEKVACFYDQSAFYPADVTNGFEDGVKYYTFERLYGTLETLYERGTDAEKTIDGKTDDVSSVTMFFTGYSVMDLDNTDIANEDARTVVAGMSASEKNFAKDMGFSEIEKAAVLPTSGHGRRQGVDDGVTFSSSIGSAYSDVLDGDTYFSLSAPEVMIYLNDAGHTKPATFLDGTTHAGSTWTRSWGRKDIPSAIMYTDNKVAWHQYGSAVHLDFRPAFNLNPDAVVAYVPVNEAQTYANDGLSFATNAGNAYRMVMLDESRSEFSVDSVETNGTVLRVTYSNAVAGENEYISCVAEDSNGTVAYTKGVNITEENGAVEFDLANTQFEGEVTVYFINENYNGEFETSTARNVSDKYTVNIIYVTDNTIQSAIDAIGSAEGEFIIVVTGDRTENVTVTQYKNQKITIVGDENKPVISGTITVNGRSNAEEGEALTLQNLAFNADAATNNAIVYIPAAGQRYAMNITIDNCDVVGTTVDAYENVALIRESTGGGKNFNVTNTTITGIHSMLQVKNITGITIDECEIIDCKNGINLNSSPAATITNTTAIVAGYAVRIGQSDSAAALSYDMLVTLDGNNFISTSNEESLLIARGGAQTADFNITSGTYKITAGMDVLSLIEGSDAAISGGLYSSNVGDYLVDGYALTRTAGGYLVVEDAEADDEGKDQADSISIKYKDITAEDAEGEKIYEVVVKANDDDMINELASVDISFAFATAPIEDGNMDITVLPATDFTISRYENTDRYMFNYNGTSAFEGTANAITVATITVEGYGSYSIATADVDTNIVNATTLYDNLVDSYTAAGATDDDTTTGGLVINEDTVADDDLVGKVENDVIAVPVRDLTINIDFPNAVVDNAITYQDMKVVISGGDLADDITIDLGSDAVETAITIDGKVDAKYVAAMANGSYVINVTDALTVNNAYTVTVSGAGYRTARYTVTMTEDKTLRFWNNVMDENQVVEIGKDSSVAKVTFLAGDIVKDNNINIYDLSAVVSYFGTEDCVNSYPEYAKYDLNRDGVIDSKDVAYVLVSWNN